MRLETITLDNVRNISHGTIRFNTLPSGGSLTGIYGQNGSGKTAVIDAIGVLKTLLSGDPLPEGTGDIINAGQGHATIKAIYRLGDEHYLEYAVELVGVSHGETEPRDARIVRESIKLGEKADRMGRIFIAHGFEEEQPDTFTREPSYLWDALMGLPDSHDMVRRTEYLAFMSSRSLLFSDCTSMRLKTSDVTTGTPLLKWLADKAGAAKRLPARLRDNLAKLTRLGGDVEALHRYAGRKTFIATTRRNASAAYWYIPIRFEENGEQHEAMFDLLKANTFSTTRAKEIRNIVETIDEILPTLVPGLHVELMETTTDPSDQGMPQTQFQLMSNRNGTRIAFRCESEGIIRLTGLLAYFVHAYNDPDALVAVDELDSGVYELLLGDILNQMHDEMKGQLVFTAHNLRGLELLPAQCIRITTTDEKQRFIPFPKLSRTDNPRRHYLSAGKYGWEYPNVYDPPMELMFTNALYLAGHPNESGEEIRKALDSLMGGDVR